MKLLPFDLNEVPIEENIVDKDIDKNEKIDEPFVGQCFLSEEEALVFYKKYARMKGFSVRKGRFENKNGVKKWRDLFCHREGKQESKDVDYSKQQRNRGSSRYEKRILLLKEGGLSVRQIMRVIELEKDVRHGELPFLVKDVHNFFTKVNKVRSPNDARELLEYCKSAKSDNPNFQFAYTIDDENRLEHICWSQAHCFNWYKKYGDVVVFDTTYKVNSYEMPFGVFVWY
ncbi:protein FAR1-RELATED SEQUENCE 11 [Artemisia annua]|uniref:Protein FAR1-RELATED SEQUENCE 11 n=1 Tax=Artemisia annua TaxID=35608 RepID=A0A2U1PNT9_ARTAN|nr:protein FAR1-RELATED SEQUENCE 11 [Artemisia annua]